MSTTIKTPEERAAELVTVETMDVYKPHTVQIRWPSGKMITEWCLHRENAETEAEKVREELAAFIRETEVRVLERISAERDARARECEEIYADIEADDGNRADAISEAWHARALARSLRKQALALRSGGAR